MTVPRSTHKKQYPKCLDKLEKAKYMGEIFMLINDELEVVKCCMPSTCKMT